MKEEDVEKFLALLNQMDNQEGSEETVVDPKDELFLRRFRMTRAGVEKRATELEEEPDSTVTRCVYLYTEGVNYLYSPDPAIRKEGNKMIEGYRRLFEGLVSPRPSKFVMYSQYMKALGRDDPIAEGGWLYELQKPLPKRVGGPLR